MNQQLKIFENLIFGPLCGHLMNILYSLRTETRHLYREGCYNVMETNQTTKAENRDIQFDAIICLSEFEGGQGKKNVHFRKAVAIEIKTSERDIYGSTIDKYLGATPYFFIAVPRSLLEAVIDRYCNHRDMKFIGLIDADNGQIVVMPQQQEYDKLRMFNILGHCYTSIHRYSAYNNIEPYAKARVTQFPRENVFVEIRGLRVNQLYKHYFDADTF